MTNPIDQEREQFELATLEYATSQIAAGKALNDNGSEPTRESLFWRDENGDYGVKLFNAAWWGWKTRAIVAHEIETALSRDISAMRLSVFTNTSLKGPLR